MYTYKTLRGYSNLKRTEVTNQKYQHLEFLLFSFFLRHGDVQLQGHGAQGAEKDPEPNGQQVCGADVHR